jgi:hypothetical protein
MRVLEKRRGYFRGTHKGGEIEIERDYDIPERKFYIRVIWKDGGYLYDGYSPVGVETMAEAKREAIRGACLDAPTPAPREDHAPEIAALRAENELLGYANVYRIKGALELGSTDIDNLEDVEPWAKDFEEHVGIAEIRLLPDTAGKSGPEVRAALRTTDEQEGRNDGY